MRSMVVAALAAAGLAFVGAAAPAAAATEPTVTVADRPGAPGEALGQLAKLTGSSLGTVERVVVVDADGVRLTAKQVEALAAGAELDGVKVLGVVPGSKDVLGTTLTDLSDGTYDGPGGIAAFRSALIFASYDGETREWCLTMCISMGRTVAQCILLSRR
ncbi:ABC-type glycerol-3-phosphate transport system substrate-binding protein [Allocatelliglobosispora scoriae]|uniref:ABC-type glycerol-3-phosphate transport system substrate-binding protein n=1 Tax=Allocatelliglobosispora scoriae TaxID=643052 RepID=A0A841C2K8_9ACTN|nr:hypothetical protein [Allocatelliglobosispora scoriae]MBB5873539.1 ABC-type glycerol-3-phosphate transport system substrate-binding protein [Allocatelliglobosispora scoriae]